MRSIAIIILIIVLSSSNLKSQSNFTIRGKIYNKQDSSAIIYCNISIKNTTVGTITNNKGEFLLHIPDSLSKKTIVFSSIGFENMILPIKQIKNDNIYYLKPKTYNLNDIIVLPIDELPEELVKKSIKNINKNYPNKRHLLKCFYRETAYKNKNAVRLIEAALDIQNYGVGQKFTKDKIKINQFRKSDDNLDYSIFSKIMYKFFGESNMIYETFESHALSNKNKFKEQMKNSKFQIDGFEMQDTIPLVVIKYADSTHRLWINYGYLHIRIDNYAILKLENYVTVKGKYKSLFKRYFIDDEDYLRSTVRLYQRINDKYYLKYIEYLRAPYGTAYSENYSDISYSQLLINEIKFTKKDYDKIRNKESVSKETDIYDIDYEYHPDFWKNYNILLTNPIQQKVKKDLEKEKKLETQFQENSK